MKKLFFLLLLLNLTLNAQNEGEMVYRKIALNSCRCIMKNLTSLEAIKSCDILSVNSLTDSEKKGLNFDLKSDESYQNFAKTLFPFRKDYCPSVTKFIEDDIKEKEFQEQVKEQQKRLDAEKDRIIEALKASQDSLNALALAEFKNSDNRVTETIVTTKNELSNISFKENKNLITTFGTFKKVKSDIFNVVIIEENGGQTLELLWLEKFEGSDLLEGNIIKKGMSLQVSYDTSLLYDDKTKNYVNFKVIKGLKLE